ncbi:hypothetical protein QAD02_020345 [Eretmocerus hayati]|uniref:Uncharacterized protein n=1 Tax=Eretmocerus hayati TaxID=131215 RepID=A0ACC2PNF0_9HYME|nr:hypothetical protein QAD02_020345 [Eretmocerus hayati]
MLDQRVAASSLNASNIEKTLQNSLSALQESVTASHFKLVNRLSSAKTLPIFTGDPLEFSLLQQTFESVVLDKIVPSLRLLPNVESGQGNIVELSTKLRNAAVAIRSLKGIGYLHNADLIRENLRKLPMNTISKLPMNTISDYVKYVSRQMDRLSNLEHLAEFLYEEAKIYAYPVS